MKSCSLLLYHNWFKTGKLGKRNWGENWIITSASVSVGYFRNGFHKHSTLLSEWIFQVFHVTSFKHPRKTQVWRYPCFLSSRKLHVRVKGMGSGNIFDAKNKVSCAQLSQSSDTLSLRMARQDLRARARTVLIDVGQLQDLEKKLLTFVCTLTFKLALTLF